MVAGLNILIDIYRMTERDDDYVGGASISGTCVYQNLQSRFRQFLPDQVFEQQGLETLRTFTFTLAPNNLDIRERDEAQLVAPFDHFYYGDRFRITGVRPSDHNPRDPRGFMELSAVRSERAHAQQ